MKHVGTKAIDIFSKHQDYADENEMKRGAYLREYNALISYGLFKKMTLNWEMV